jgi:alpha-1,3-rhamnosyl/mannosyltransferase
MNIVFDARVIQDHFPGIGRYAFNLLAELPEHMRPDETLVVLHDSTAMSTRLPIPALREKLWLPGVHWIDWPAPIFDARNVLGLLPHLPHVTPGAIAHFPYYVHPVISKLPSVTTIYDAISFVYPEYTPSSLGRLTIRLLHELAIRASRMVITISQSAARDLVRFFPSAQRKLVVTPLAPDPIFAPRSEDAIRRVREKFGLAEPFALYLASNKPHKNLIRLMEAWKLVDGYWLNNTQTVPLTNTQHPTLVIAGHQDPRYPQALERARELGIVGRVRVVGAVPDDEAAALYSACELFVFPSLYEGFGLTPLEAMACGAPVACSNTSSLPEVAGDAALTFDPTKPDEIASTCLRTLNDPSLQSSLRECSLRQAAAFTWSETARRTIEVYRAHRPHL